MKKSTYFLTLIYIISSFIIFKFVPNKTFSTLEEKAEFQLQTNQTEDADSTLKLLITQNNRVFINHYNYLTNHLNLPSSTERYISKYETETIYRDDSMLMLYNNYSNSADTVLSDIGNYMLGLVELSANNYNVALNHFTLVKNQKLYNYNFYRGLLHYKNNEIKSALYYINKEIENDGNLNLACNLLAEIHIKQGDIKLFGDIVNHHVYSDYLDINYKLSYYFHNNFFMFLIEVIHLPFINFNFITIFFLSVITFAFVYYIKKLDVFKEENWKNTFVFFISGIFLFFIFYILTKTFEYYLQEGYIRNKSYPLLFNILFSFIKELFKIIPLLLTLKYSEIIDEPYNYIFYASITALGFNYFECFDLFANSNNLMFHSDIMLKIIINVLTSSVVAYSLILAKYPKIGYNYSNFAISILAVSLFAFIFNLILFIIKNSDFQLFRLVFHLADFAAPILFYIWIFMKNNALNNSDFFDIKKTFNINELNGYFKYIIFGSFLLEFLTMSIIYGPKLLLMDFFISSAVTIFILRELGRQFDNFNLTKGKWLEFKFKDEYKEFIFIDFKKHIYYIDKLSKNNEEILKLLPSNCKIQSQVELSVLSKECCRVQFLNEIIDIEGYHSNFIIIVFDVESNPAIKDYVKVEIYLVPKKLSITIDYYDKRSLYFCGYGILSKVGEDNAELLN